MTTRPMRFFEIDQFDLDANTGVFTAMASDLGVRAADTPVGFIAEDACQLGLYLRHTTGVTVAYYLDHREEREGDTMWWQFKVTPASARRTPAAANTTVRIYND